MWLVAAVAVALLVLPWMIALALARHHHLDATAVGILAAVSIPLSGLWIAWVTLAKGDSPGAAASGLSMAQVADQLAVAVGAQWDAEARVRRLNDPYPLPVSWTAADASLADTWESLVRLATGGAGWRPSPHGEAWAVGPDGLGGEGGELADVLARVPTGRLVVLGEPGAGKTMLMVRLVLDLLARRATGGPVPFLASVASWDPTGQDLRGWLVARSLIDHPALAAASPEGRGEANQAEALLAAGLILPILDGLDEIPEQVRGVAISRINDALRPGEQVIVTCRTQQYRDAVRPPDGIEVTLRASAAIELRPLDADAVRSYLLEDAAGPTAKARWDPVLAVLGTEAPVAQALRTPLMASLARVIYNLRPGEPTGDLRDPGGELCDPALADRNAIESLLFDAFIPAAYRTPTAGRWTTRQTEKWLVFLARHLEQEVGGPDLAWWRLGPAAPPAGFVRAAWLLFGLVGVVVGGLVGRHAGELWYGLAGGLVFGLMSGLVAGLPRIDVPARGVRLEGSLFLVGLTVGLLSGLLMGLLGGVGLTFALTVGLLIALLMPLAGGGLAGKPGDLAEATSPRIVLARDRQAALLIMLGAGLAAGLTAGLVIGLSFGLSVGLAAGLAVGFVAGLAAGMRQTVWPSYVFTRGWLALHHRLPWPLMSFLADAHQRGVLRQAGAYYQFRHIELQHRLANRDASPQETDSSAAPPAADR
jgi:NACHT domain